jgi:hypothetical protein
VYTVIESVILRLQPANVFPNATNICGGAFKPVSYPTKLAHHLTMLVVNVIPQISGMRVLHLSSDAPQLSPEDCGEDTPDRNDERDDYCFRHG